jgi:transcriptional regulator with XRE-family HTH domain
LLGVSASPLHDRLAAAAASMTYRQVGEVTRTHPETVRRYMQGQSPSVEFLETLAHALGLSGEWLLTGRGPMKLDEARLHALRESNATDLLSAVASTMERLIERVDRLEQYTQTLETRLRAAARASDHDTPAAPVTVTRRAILIADALPQRRTPDAG